MDFLKEEDLFNMIKTIVLSVYPSTLRKSRCSSLMQTRKIFSTNLGLKTFIKSHEETTRTPSDQSLVFHACMMKCPSSSPSASPLLSSPSNSLRRSLSLSSSTSYSSQSDILGDLIGSESGIHLESEVGQLYAPERPPQPCYRFQRRRNQRQLARRKDYPPTLTILEKKDWALSRHYVDGRLLLIEDRAKPKVYFKAHRDNGRLILKHVTVEDNISEEKDDTELQNLEFIEEEDEEERGQGREKMDEEEEEKLKNESSQQVKRDNVGGIDDDHVTSMVKIQGKMKPETSKPSSVPKSLLKNEGERLQVLPRCATYAGFNLSDFNLPCNARANAHDNASIYQSGFLVAPITTVV